MADRKKSVEIIEPETGLDFDDESVGLVKDEVTETQISSLDSLAVDPNVELTGLWFPYPGTSIEFKVAHAENENYQDYFQQLIRPYLSLAQSNTKEGFRFIRRIEAKARSRYVLVDWRGMTDANGKPLPYNEKTAFDVLSERKYRKIRRFVENCANDESAFDRSSKEREAAGKD